MSHEEVRSLLGEPDVQRSYPTARAWLPFYSGADASEIEWTYRGEGIVVFSLDCSTGMLRVRRVRDFSVSPR